MKRRNANSNPPPVEHIELDESNAKRRGILAIVLLAIGITAIGFGLHAALSRESGWTEIEGLKSASGCTAEFRLQYDLPEKNTTQVYRDISALYTSACDRAAKVYDSTQTYDGVSNLRTLNDHPNEAVKVEPELYAALVKIRDSGSRMPYLAPLNETYSSLFFCTTDEETAAYDPQQDPTIAAAFTELAGFANDPEQIDLELLSDNRVRLKISDAYLDYAAENGVGCYFDLGWMKNAFIADDLAAALRKQGFTDGYLESQDGFGCNLCDRHESFSMNLFDCDPNAVRVIAEISYQKPLCYVSLHSVSINPSENDWFYEMENGEVRSIYLDPADGRPKTAMNDLTVWSGKLSCAELVLRAASVFVADDFDAAMLESSGMEYAYCVSREIICSDKDIQFAQILDGYTVKQN